MKEEMVNSSVGRIPPIEWPPTVEVLIDEIERLAPAYCGWRDGEFEHRRFLWNAGRKGFRQRYYHQFTIPKKSGGQRTINAPRGWLKDAQKVIAYILENRVYKAPESVHGFVSKRSIVTNAELHTRQNYVFNTDLSNFFPSITDSMVFNALVRKGITKEVARYISVICTMTVDDGDLPVDVLPQGSPASPVLANIVCFMMDITMQWIASRYGLTYSRYADDMTFSSPHNVYAKGGEFMKEFRLAVAKAGFTVNEEKTRLQKRGGHQEVTGLTVYRKINVSRKYIKNLRAQLFQMEMNGFSRKEWCSAYGKVNFVGMVRGPEDPLYRRMLVRITKMALYPKGMIATAH